MHNTRIERLWVDVKVQVSGRWYDTFGHLEDCHGLDIDNQNHVWLLQTLFLPRLNCDLMRFKDGWNNHQLRRSGHEHRTPAEMFVMGMYERGVRGFRLPTQTLAQHYIPRPEGMLRVPPHLNSVEVNPPDPTEERDRLLRMLMERYNGLFGLDPQQLWTLALADCRTACPGLF